MSLVLIISTIIIIAIAIVFVYLALRSSNGTTNDLDVTANVKYSPSSPVSFMYRCGDSDNITCADGYTCDSGDGTCRVPLGGPCNTYADCETGNYCSGICYNSNNDPPSFISGNIGDPCPCDYSTQSCVPNPNNNTLLCLVKGGGPCNNDSDCISGVCNNDGLCICGQLNGTVCEIDKECQNGNCSLAPSGTSLCQNDGISSGSQGAACQASVDCRSGLTCENGICASTDTGLDLSCNATLICPEPMVCNNILDGSLCAADDEECKCSYQLTSGMPDPNGCRSGSCLNGYSCKRVEGIGVSAFLCQAPSGQPCRIDGDCMGSQCGDGSIYRIIFKDDNGDDITTTQNSAIGSSSVRWQPFSSIPAGGVDRIMSVTTSDNSDILYVINSTGAFFRRESDNEWTEVASSDSTKELIDGSITTWTSGVTILYLIFKETATNANGDTVTNWTLWTWNILNGLYPNNIMPNSNFLDGTQYTSDGDPINNVKEIDVKFLPSAANNTILLYDGYNIYVNNENKSTAYSTIDPLSTDDNNTTFASSIRFFEDQTGILSNNAFGNISYINAASDNNGSGYIDTTCVGSNTTGTISCGCTDALSVGKVITMLPSNIVYFPYNLFCQNNSFNVFTYDIHVFNAGSSSSSLINSTIALVSLGENNMYSLYIINSVQETFIPGYVNNSTRVTVSDKYIYVYTSGSCE